MDPSDLENKIKLTIKNNDEPLIICSTSGTTVLGAFDNIKANNSIAKKYDLWHHVDGAWGGPAIFTPRLSPLIEGLEETDSFTFDAHKALGTGLITSFFILQNENDLRDANTQGGESYLFHDYENSDYDSGGLSIQCGRKVDALKFWLYWKSVGHDGLENEINERLELASYLKEKIEKDSRLKLIGEPKYLNICFQVLPSDNSDINEFNRDLRFELVQKGQLMVNFSSFEDGTVFFRQVFANNLITKDSVDKFLEIIFKTARLD
jgi:glutamate/tyrosine decarboxylase-like PLP-dependent enzyme